MNEYVGVSAEYSLYTFNTKVLSFVFLPLFKNKTKGQLHINTEGNIDERKRSEHIISKGRG